ncbi:hypothetical protein NDU88_001059 [Pleurodeles waltl]|uniref:Uncharacterized protein n=1 Tax=Pleurodeles waltl TaxID=8319 RepID=A0AAV7KZR0_PLEWA|nr:hypothetical protein NDU88_001059 [Pleurodeles waltl]
MRVALNADSSLLYQYTCVWRGLLSPSAMRAHLLDSANAQIQSSMQARAHLEDHLTEKAVIVPCCYVAAPAFAIFNLMATGLFLKNIALFDTRLSLEQAHLHCGHKPALVTSDSRYGSRPGPAASTSRRGLGHVLTVGTALYGQEAA